MKINFLAFIVLHYYPQTFISLICHFRLVSLDFILHGEIANVNHVIIQRKKKGISNVILQKEGLGIKAL